jgi:hypothetical protein
LLDHFLDLAFGSPMMQQCAGTERMAARGTPYGPACNSRLAWPRAALPYHLSWTWCVEEGSFAERNMLRPIRFASR